MEREGGDAEEGAPYHQKLSEGSLVEEIGAAFSNQQFAPRQLIENGSIQSEASLAAVSVFLPFPSTICLSDCLFSLQFYFSVFYSGVRVTDCKLE